MEKKWKANRLQETEKKVEMVERDNICNNLFITRISMDTSSEKLLDGTIVNMFGVELRVKAKMKGVYKIWQKK